MCNHFGSARGRVLPPGHYLSELHGNTQSRLDYSSNAVCIYAVRLAENFIHITMVTILIDKQTLSIKLTKELLVVTIVTSTDWFDKFSRVLLIT